ncbi:MAG: homocysteine S-methyltransferase family protein [Nitrospirae bacterium]|nr:homocysteine S-methyltransferase family protein [Nitrospirota bacterium]
MSEILERLKKEILLLDGSMGALLQERNLPSGYAPDLWNIERPEAIIEVHQEYISAGSQIILTNTFGASRLRLAEYSAQDKIREINAAAVQHVRTAARGKKVYVAGDVGPSGTTIAPFGELPFDQAIEIFYEQCIELVRAGCDLIAIETMFDLQEMKAAVIAAKEATKGKDIPIMAHMTFTQDGITDTGSDAETAATVLEGLGVDILGVNCSTGPEHMLPVVKTMAQTTRLFISAEPNAGLPVQLNGKTVFPASSEEMASYAERFLEAGVNILGGCCGTTPDYIRKIKNILKDKKPAARNVRKGMKISSRMRTVFVGPGHPFLKIGEKINPTGKKLFSQAIKEGRTDLIVAAARKQFEAGAHALDINVGVPLVDEAEMMKNAVTAIQNVVNIPLVIDSSYVSALEQGMIYYPGKALVNSVNAEEERIEEIFPLVKKYGAAVIALVAGDDIPETAAQRIKNAEYLIKRAEDFKVPKENIIFDCLALTVSAVQEAAAQTLETIRLVSRDLGSPTTLGLSNVSFGLPNRHLVHNTFLAQCISAGLDAAILDPYDLEMHQVASAASLFARRDPECRRYIQVQADLEGNKAAPKDECPQTTRDKIYKAVLEGERESIVQLVKTGIDEKLDAFDMFLNVMTPAIRKLGDLFGERKKFIPHLVASADTMKRGVEFLQPYLEKSGNVEKKGTIIFATVKGDIHDIGKNICCLMLRNFGFNVVDLGRNVHADLILKAAEEHKADIIALSALMTTTMMQMKVVAEEVRAKKLPCKIMIGGAVTTKKFAEEIGVDAYGKDVGEVVTVAENLLERQKNVV